MTSEGETEPVVDYSDVFACEALKQAHHKCFISWLDRVMKGVTRKDECEALYLPYQACLEKKLSAIGYDQYMKDWKPVSPEDVPTFSSVHHPIRERD